MDDDEDDARPTTAITALIFDRPQEVVNNAVLQRDIATRMMQPIEQVSLGYAPLETEAPVALPPVKKLSRQATGVAVAPPSDRLLYLWIGFCAVAAAAMIYLAL